MHASPGRFLGHPDAGGIIAARLQTDHLDLWQIRGVSFDNDPELFIRPNGAAEALDLAKQQGEVRMKPFSGKGEQLKKASLPSISQPLLC